MIYLLALQILLYLDYNHRLKEIDGTLGMITRASGWSLFQGTVVLSHFLIIYKIIPLNERSNWLSSEQRPILSLL